MFATPRASDQDDRFMAPLGSSSDSGRGGLGKSGNDAVKLTIDYVKQETLAPLKGLLRFAAAGVSGSIAIAIGVVLILVGAHRRLVVGALFRRQCPRAGRGRRGRLAHHSGTGPGQGARGPGPSGGRCQRTRHEGRKQLMASPGTRRITREDLQAAYAQVVGEGEASAKAAAPQGIAVIGAAALAVVTVAFFAGRRRGRSRSAVVEIRRL
jgi:hypothetical protein